jgi:23S rRNA (adenine2503-C2)-methyltransferase
LIPRNVAGAIDVIADLMEIGRGKITVSTSGIAPLIPKVATDLRTMLAISLHAPNDELRSQIMAINNTYPLATLIQACQQFIELARCARRRITFEYVMLDQVNDSEELAYELGELVKPLQPHINLIPFNEWPGAPYQASSKSQIKAFGRILTEKFSIPTTIRWSRGKGIRRQFVDF